VGRFQASGDVVRSADPFTVSGTFTLTANKGTLTGTYEGWWQIPEPFVGILPVGGSFVVTGGTAKYAGASGSGVITGEVEFTGQGAVLRVTFDGTLST